MPNGYVCANYLCELPEHTCPQWWRREQAKRFQSAAEAREWFRGVKKAHPMYRGRPVRIVSAEERRDEREILRAKLAAAEKERDEAQRERWDLAQLVGKALVEMLCGPGYRLAEEVDHALITEVHKLRLRAEAAESRIAKLERVREAAEEFREDMLDECRSYPESIATLGEALRAVGEDGKNP